MEEYLPLDESVNLSDRQTVCDICLVENLTEPITHASCARCFITYCSHFASAIDPQFCMHCMKELEITEELLIRKSTHINEDTNQVYTRTQRARHIVFGGTDWLFMQRKINTISDAELAMAIEYHQAIYNGMIYERERRRIEHFHRNAGKSYRVTTNGTESTDGTEVIVKKTRKTKVLTPEAADVKLRATLEAMLHSGKTPEQIMQMFAQAKPK